MKGLMNFFETKFVPVASRIGAQRHLVAIRDGFVALMPIIIAGSFAVLLNNLPIPQFQALMTSVFGDGWKAFGGNIWWGTFAVISVFLAFSIAYNLAKSYNGNPLGAGLMSLASYFILVPQVSPTGGWGDISWGYLNATAMFVAIIVALTSTELFVRLSRSDKLIIKMPEGVPPSVSRSFATLFPGMIVLAVFSFLSIALTKTVDGNLFALINRVVAAPISEAVESLGAVVFIVFFNQLLWFFGLHGSNIIGGIIEPILLPALEANMAAINAGLAPQNIVTKPFLDAFVYLGGSGATLGLLIAMFVGGKRKQNREMAKLGTAPGLFNINEPVIFGLPIVLNPFLIIPFILGPVIITIISYTAMSIGLVPLTYVMVPWTTPPVIGGMLATGSLRGGLLAAVNLALSIGIYLPFVKLSENAEAKAEAKAAEKAQRQELETELS